ncbi:hypothetical protein MASR2M44_26290 [Bacteroidota bacterium]
MKKFFQFLVVVALLVAGNLRLANAQTVYVTEKGKKFHAKNCDLVKTGKTGMELAEAKKAGYSPCGHCKAEAKAPAKKETPAKTKKK